MFCLINDGPLVAETDYWSSEAADHGLVYGSWNGGTLRLLLPTGALLSEMRIGSACKLRYMTLHGVAALEVEFDDGSESLFQVTMDNRQSNRLIPRLHQTTCRVLAYTRAGLEAE